MTRRSSSDGCGQVEAFEHLAVEARDLRRNFNILQQTVAWAWAFFLL